MEDQSASQTSSRSLRVVASPLLVNVDHAARLLGMSKTAFTANLAAGKIGPRPIRFGRSVRFSVAELAEWCHADCPPRVQWVEIRTARQYELRKAQ